MEDKDPLIPHIEYHGHWCPVDVQSQGISSHGIDLDLPGSSVFSTPSVNVFVLVQHIVGVSSIK